MLEQAVAELERIAGEVLKWKGWTEMPVPVITIQTRGKQQGVLGWCTTAPIWTAKQTPDGKQPDKRFEINMVAEEMHRPATALVATLLHEMAHYRNWYQGVKDCTVNQYHNKKFKDTAESLGLVVTQQGNRGWAATEMGRSADEFFFSINVQREAFAYRRLEIAGDEGKKSKNKYKKWTCCCTTVRCATQLNARCGSCGERFELEEGVEEA